MGGSTYLNNAGGSAGTYRIQHVMPAGLRVAAPRALFTNYAGQFRQDLIQVLAASLEISGLTYQLSFFGALTTSLTAGGSVVSDPLGGDLDPAAAPYSRTYISLADATKRWPVGIICNSQNGEGSSIGSPGTDLTGGTFGFATGNPTLNTQIAFSPAAIIGVPSVNIPAVALITDSIGQGTGDSGSSFGAGDTNADFGWCLRALNRKIPYGFISKYGEQAATLASTIMYRTRILEFCTHAVCTYGVNDVQASASLATLQANMLKIWLVVAGRRLPLWQTTLTPVSSSTDNFATVGNQTPHANNAVRVNFNNWLRAGAPIDPATKLAVAIGTGGALLAGALGHPLNGYLEVADQVESARNSGLWKVHATRARVLTDGAMSSVSNQTTLNSASGAFTSADIGRAVTVVGAGGGAGLLLGFIVATPSGTTATLSIGAFTTVSSATVAIGAYTSDGVHPSADGHIAAATAMPTSTFTATGGYVLAS
jgi:hypothetical protein